MNASLLPKDDDAKPRPKQPFFSYTEALIDLILGFVVAFFLAWLNFPFYAQYIVVGVFILVLIGANFFRRRRSRVPPR